MFRCIQCTQAACNCAAATLIVYFDGLCCLPGYRLDHPDHRTVATHVSLDSLSVHKLQPGHYVAPLLCSGDTSLPFAIGLELFSSTCHDDTEEAGDVLLPELPESEGLLSLQYILDGRAQVVLLDSLDPCWLLTCVMLH